MIVEVGDTFRGHLVSPSLFKHGYLKQVCPGPSEDGFGKSPRRETAQPPWVTYSQCLVTPSFLMFRTNPLCFSLCPLALLLSLGIAEKSLTLFAPSLQVFIYTDDIFPEHSFLQAKQSQAFPHRTEVPVHSSPLWTCGGFSPLCPCVLLYWWAQNWTQDSLLVLPRQCWIETFSHFQTSRNYN